MAVNLSPRNEGAHGINKGVCHYGRRCCSDGLTAKERRRLVKRRERAAWKRETR